MDMLNESYGNVSSDETDERRNVKASSREGEPRTPFHSGGRRMTVDVKGGRRGPVRMATSWGLFKFASAVLRKSS